MSQIQLFHENIIGCPECIQKRGKTDFFKDIQDVNIHLKMKHGVSYKITIAGKLKGSAEPISRLLA